MFGTFLVSALLFSQCVLAWRSVPKTAGLAYLLQQDKTHTALAVQPLITGAPRYDEKILLGRATLQTCGYVSGNAGMRAWPLSMS